MIYIFKARKNVICFDKIKIINMFLSILCFLLPYKIFAGEAPMLSEMVKKKLIPPLTERLPNDPKVIPVVSKIGKYGGTLRIGDILERLDEGLRIRHTGLFRYDFTASKYQPDLAKDHKWSNKYRTLTITLRSGLKWSDGNNFDTTDIRWFWENVLDHPKVSPNGLPGFLTVGGTPAKLKVINNNKFSITWGQPNPGAMDRFGRTHFSGDNVLYAPSHYLKEFHEDFNPKAQQLAEKLNYKTWVDLLNARRCQCYQQSMVALDRPVLDSFYPTDNRGGKIKLIRNPYFHHVDSNGNQLPYIDKIEVSHTGDQDLYALKITAGEIDFGARFTRTSDMQLYKEKESSGNYKTYMAKSLRPSEKSIFINHNYPDKEYNKLFNNLKFRIALSQSINRQQINDVLFFGMAEVHPPTPLKTIPWYKKEWENEYLKYKPKNANNLLDNLGLNKKNNSGIRLLPSGKPLNIIIQTIPIHTDGCQMVANDFRSVGIGLICQEVTFELIKQVVEENTHMAIMWHIGRATLFGRGTPDSFAFDRPIGNFWASKWTLWLSTNGQAGIEPPDNIKALDKLWDKFSLYPSDSKEAVKVGGEYYSYFAEKLPVISTVGLIPQPVIYSNRLGNIPTKNIYWGSDNNFYAPFHIEQWYIK